MDIVLRSICDRLLQAPSVVSLVGERVYPVHLSTLTEVRYPCVTLYRAPGVRENYVVHDFEIYLSGWSPDVDESWNAAELAAGILDGTGVTTEGVVYTVEIVSTPYLQPDTDENLQLVIQTILRLRVRQLG